MPKRIISFTCPRCSQRHVYEADEGARAITGTLYIVPTCHPENRDTVWVVADPAKVMAYHKLTEAELAHLYESGKAVLEEM